MKTTNRLLAVLLSLVLLCSALPFAFAEDVTIVDSGTSGRLTWTLDSAGTLTISGNGSMNSYSYTNDNGTTRTSALWGKYYQTMQTVVLNDGVTSIGSNAFYGCTALTSVTIGNSVTSIGSNAFYGCTALKSVNISDVAAWCGIDFSNSYSNPLYYAKNLHLNGEPVNEVTIPDGVTSIGDCAFYNCTSLTSVTIPDSVTSIGSSAFDRYLSTSNGSYYLPTATLLCNKDSYAASWAESSKYPYVLLDGTDEDNIISETVNAKLSYRIDKRTRTLNVFNQGKLISFSSYNAPWRKYQQYVETAILSDGCTSVSEKAFYECYNLKRVVLPETIETIDVSAFYDCVSLQDITILDAVTSIGDYAFYNCSSLQNIVIPDSVTSLGEYYYGNNFYGCTSLKSVVIGDGLTQIPSYAFRDCTALETVSIGDNVTRIYYEAFSGCSKLSTVLFGEKVQYIYDGAFANCSSLPAVDLPASVSSIGARAFSDSALKDITIRNANCEISQDAISLYATIHGYAGSTAERFADDYGYYFVELEPHEHVFGEWVESDWNGCEKTYIRNCAICNLQESKTEEAHHFYESSRTGSCTEGGTITYRCGYCGTEKTETLPATGHHYDRYVKGICSEPHDVIYTCKYCGDRYVEREDATEHTFGESVTDTTCGGKIEIRGCTLCGYTEETVITEPTHDFTEIKRMEPNCGNDGFIVYQCKNCGKTKEEVLPAQGEHDYNTPYYKVISDTQHTVNYYCKNCKNTIVETVDHSFGDWIEDSKPTCTEPGVSRRICSECSYQQKKTTPSLGGHTFTPWSRFVMAEDAAYEVEIRFCNTCGYYELRQAEKTDPGEDVTTPTDPTNPTDPTDPTDPTSQTDPTDPTDPTNPTNPTDPTEPVTEPTTEQPPEEEAPQGFFARIAAFFRNLFARLFGGRNR